jgi:ATP-binding cassette, subfamily B, bacterial MsbA
VLCDSPAKRLVRLHLELNNGLVGVRMLFELMDAPATEPPDDDKPGLVVGPGRIEVAGAEFRYRRDAPVISGMSFIAEPGRMTALVGRSGGGKSTVFNLLLRLYELEGGVIRIDSQDIAAVSRGSLRRQLAYVGQDVFLFRGSIRENIRFGKPDADEAEIVAAARAAHAHDFIVSLPAGYDTPSASTACSCPAASASEWRSPALCCATRPSSCSTRRPPPSIPNRSVTSRMRSPACAPGALPW